MDTSSSPLPEETRDAARALIEQRATLEEWLARLSETSQSVPAHVVDRVREDYTERLRRVTEELGAHQGAIRQDVETLRERLAEAEARRSDATDRLEELRLRHLIGEVDDAAWDEQRPPLEAEVEQAEEVRGSLGAELEQIETLLSDVEAAGADHADAATAAEEDPWAGAAAVPSDAEPEAAGATRAEDGSAGPGDALEVDAAHAAPDDAESAAPAEEEQGWSPIQDDSWPAGEDDEVAGIVTAEATAGEEEPAAEAAEEADTEIPAELARDPEDAGDDPVADIAALVPDTAPGAAGGDEVGDGTVDSSGWLTDEDDWDADLPALDAPAAAAGEEGGPGGVRRSRLPSQHRRGRGGRRRRWGEHTRRGERDRRGAGCRGRRPRVPLGPGSVDRLRAGGPDRRWRHREEDDRLQGLRIGERRPRVVLRGVRRRAFLRPRAAIRQQERGRARRSRRALPRDDPARRLTPRPRPTSPGPPRRAATSRERPCWGG